ncbi:uncharacterized protein LOC119407014 [Rhipicephalus sanguineus]|uniref:uncharacterized protein LOC119407014 n=1 Tax=Rhipicephalus sanguineus TaxID=34632 RepID=UPI001892DDF8|nr:uncharacterized protein LOC119407014 [Rhipicephalus sanguineus]
MRRKQMQWRAMLVAMGWSSRASRAMSSVSRSRTSTQREVLFAGHKPCAARVSTSDRTLDMAKFQVSITKNEPHRHVHVHVHIHLDLMDFALKFLTWLCQFVYDQLK